MDITMNGCHIVSTTMSSQYFCFTNYLVNSTLRMKGCTVDSTDTTALYSTQMFKLDWQVNSLVLQGCEFYGSMTPNPATITAPWPKAVISKLTGSAGSNGITDKIYISDCNFDIGTMTTFLDKGTAFAQISDFYVCNNKLNITSSNFTWNPTGVTKYVMANNVFTNTTSAMQTIP